MRCAILLCNVILILMLLSCHSSKTAALTSAEMKDKDILFTPGPAALVYKTRKDYAKHVPILMNESKTKIISYPAPADIYYNGKLAYPTPLQNGYLLDNRGINKNIAFLNYTYEEYSKLKAMPSVAELEARIIDKHPLTELWNCGSRLQYKNEVKELNELIEAGFPMCKSEITVLILPATP